MMRRLAFLLVMLVGTVTAVDHRQPKGYHEGAFGEQRPISHDLATTLEAPTAPILLGSGWVVHYLIHNRGLSLLEWVQGGDYRARRPTRVWLEAVDPNGELAVDPLGHTEVYCMGGMGGPISIDPLGSSAITVNAGLYVRIDRPGRWTLRMFHDLGMGPARGEDDPRWASATVEVIAPTEEQARAVLAEHDSRLTAQLGTGGKRNSPRADFSAMAFPLYLPLLAARVRAGSRVAIDGVAAIPNAEAVDCLLEILTREPGALPAVEATYYRTNYGDAPHPWIMALDALRERLPTEPDNREQLGEGDARLLATIDEARREQITNAALRLSRNLSAEIRRAAEHLLERCRLTPDQLLPLLDAAVARSSSINDLHFLLAAFRANGGPPPEPRSDGALAAWLNHLFYHADVRPEGWQVVLEVALDHQQACLRTMGLELIPSESAARWSAIIQRRLTDPHDEVRNAAIDAAARTRDVAALPLLRAMTGERQIILAASAIGRIAGLREGAEVLLSVIEKSNDAGLISSAFSSLISEITHCGHGGGWSEDDRVPAERKALVARWRAFLDKRHDDLARGSLGPPDDSWPVDLMPSQWRISLPDGAEWPRGR